MTGVHCHVGGGDRSVREFTDRFAGVHPWEAERWNAEAERVLEDRLMHDRSLGVGEIGLDRLRTRTISAGQRTAFRAQLALAARLRRPAVLHGAKCWGEVVKTIREVEREAGRAPSFLFHGFSRSPGLVPEIAALGGFVSVGPAVLNGHAVNYRELVRTIPDAMLLVETDRTEANAATCPGVGEVLGALAEVRGVAVTALEALTDSNADRFLMV